MGTPTQVCVWSCPNFSAPAGRPFRISTPVYVDPKSSTQADGAQSSRVPVPLPEDPYEAIRQDGTDTESEPFEDSTDTETPDSPLAIAPPIPLSESTPPVLVPILRKTAHMVVRVPHAMSSGLSASMAEVAAMSESALRKRFRSSCESSPSVSPPDLPLRKRYRGTVSEDAEDEGPTTKDEDPAAEDEGHTARVESPGMDESRVDGLDDEVMVGMMRVVGSGSAPVSERPKRVSAFRQPTLTTWTGQRTMQGGLISDHAVRLEELSPALFERISTLVYVDPKSSTQADGAQSSRVPVPLPEDPYEAIRQDGTDTESEPFEDPTDTETPDSPLAIPPPIPLSKSTPPVLVPILRKTAHMIVRVPHAMSSGLSASMVEVAAMLESALRKRFWSFCESSPSVSPPDLPLRKRYREDEGPTTKDEDPAAEDEGHTARVESPGMDEEGYGLDDEGYGRDDESRGIDDEGHIGSGSAPVSERPKRVSAFRQPTLTTWTGPEDGMIYIDIPDYPPPAPPV
ncbi:hypothetical protein Tco_0251297 [Tanacetum coccineum]